MKTRVNGLNELPPATLITCFGRARLFARPDGQAELRGGSASDGIEAKEWISLFMHEAVLQVFPAN